MTRPRLRTRWLPLLALLGAACAASGAEQPPPAPGGADAAPARPGAALPSPRPPSPIAAPAAQAVATAPVAGPNGELVRVGGRTIGTADLGEHVLRWDPDVAQAALRRVVEAALVESEAAREGVTVPEGEVEPAVERAVAERVRRLRLEHGAATDADALLRRLYGRSLADLRADLRRAVRIDLLRERLARLDALRRDGIDLRVLVLDDERTAADAAARWRKGVDGALLARGLGVPAPEAPPAVGPEDVPDPGLRARLVGAAPGDVLDPVPFEADDPANPPLRRTWWQVFKVVRSWRGSAAPWGELAAGIEAGLRAAPPTERELQAWESRAARRAGVTPWASPGAREPQAPRSR